MYILTGKMVCGICGGSYVGNARKSGRSQVKYYLYACNRRTRTLDCVNKEIRKEFIENCVLDKIMSFFNSMDIDAMADKLEKLYQEQYQGNDVEIKQVKDSISVLKQKLTGIITPLRMVWTQPMPFKRSMPLPKKKMPWWAV